MTHLDITPEQEAAERSRPPGRTKLTRLIVVVLVLFAWFGLAGVGGPLVGRLSEVQKNDNASFLPKSAESTEVGKLAAKFSSTDALPYFPGDRARDGPEALGLGGCEGLHRRYSVPSL